MARASGGAVLSFAASGVAGVAGWLSLAGGAISGVEDAVGKNPESEPTDNDPKKPWIEDA